MIDALVTATGLLLGNAELLWVRSYDAADTVELIVGTSMEARQVGPEIWHYFSSSECEQWDPEVLGCLVSRLQIGMTPEVPYDLVAWTEPANRRQPERQMVELAEGWVFRPADIDMDGVVACPDRIAFAAAPYDWNQDGQTTAADLDSLAVAMARSLADLDADGVIGETDLVLFLENWGSCSHSGQPCPADLTCDGVVDIYDLLLFLAVSGS